MGLRLVPERILKIKDRDSRMVVPAFSTYIASFLSRHRVPTVHITWRKQTPRNLAILLSLTAIILLVSWLSAQSYQRFRREAETMATDLAGVLSENIDETIQRTERDLRVFAKFVRPQDLSPTVSKQRRDEIETLMGSHLRKFHQVTNYRIFSAMGDSIFSAGRTPTVINVSDREWFITLRDDSSKDFIISDVVVGKGTKTCFVSKICGRAAVRAAFQVHDTTLVL